jgi:uncharacterized membrane protein
MLLFSGRGGRMEKMPKERAKAEWKKNVKLMGFLLLLLVPLSAWACARWQSTCGVV